MTILAVLRNVGPELSLTELTEEMPGRFPKEEVRAEADKMVADGVLPVIASQDSKPSRPKLRAE